MQRVVMSDEVGRQRGCRFV